MINFHLNFSIILLLMIGLDDSLLPKLNRRATIKKQKAGGPVRVRLRVLDPRAGGLAVENN
jgi:hypothetical protein